MWLSPRFGPFRTFPEGFVSLEAGAADARMPALYRKQEERGYPKAEKEERAGEGVTLGEV